MSMLLDTTLLVSLVGVLVGHSMSYITPRPMNVTLYTMLHPKGIRGAVVDITETTSFMDSISIALVDTIIS